MDILVTCDIAETDGGSAALLLRIGNICSMHGQRVQNSAFECRLSATRVTRKTGEIDDAVDKVRDSVNLCRLPGRIQVFTDLLARDCGHELGQQRML